VQFVPALRLHLGHRCNMLTGVLLTQTNHSFEHIGSQPQRRPLAVRSLLSVLVSCKLRYPGEIIWGGNPYSTTSFEFFNRIARKRLDVVVCGHPCDGNKGREAAARSSGSLPLLSAF
jgi:hypothetical protein